MGGAVGGVPCHGKLTTSDSCLQFVPSGWALFSPERWRRKEEEEQDESKAVVEMERVREGEIFNLSREEVGGTLSPGAADREGRKEGSEKEAF